jgi:TonB family protein
MVQRAARSGDLPLGVSGLGGGGGDGRAPGSPGVERGGVVGALNDLIVVRGALEKEYIDAVVRHNLPSLRACYQERLSRDPSLEGRIVVRFVITPEGTVSTSQVQSSTVGDRQVGACVADCFRSFLFPHPRNGTGVAVAYPLWFSPE